MRESSYQQLVDLGNSLGPAGSPLRELVVGAAYDLQVLANVAAHLPRETQEVRPVKKAIERWKS